MINNFYKMEEIPINSIIPQGWLKKYLQQQKDGLTGNLQAAGFPFDTVGWDNFDKENDEKIIDNTIAENNWAAWVPYEQVAYWLDGMERCGELLSDKSLIAHTQKSIDYVIDTKDPDGYLGPKFLKFSNGWFRWPHVVFFRMLIAKYSAIKDNKVLEAICKHYLNSAEDLSSNRDVINVEIMLWAYLNSGDKRLLDLAEKTYANYNKNCSDDNCVASQLSHKKPYAHGVTYNEFSKLGAILYAATGNKNYLNPSLAAYKKIDRHFMLADGLHSSCEFMLGNDYMQSHETCDVSDYTWAIGYMLMATGDGIWADKIERCIFNAGIGSVEENFKALQYFSCPNQLILDNTSNHNLFFKGDKWMSYRPNPGTECCAGNVNRFFPNYCARMWMQKQNDIFAVLYGASKVSYNINGINIKISEQTDYPFDDRIKFVFKTPQKLKLRFFVRIPAWCENPQIFASGKEVKVIAKDGFALIEREYENGDEISLILPSEIKMCNYKNKGCYVEKGPLVYALGMKGERIIDTKETKCTKDFPAYNIYPDKAWNYGMCADISQVGFTKNAMSDTPWNMDNAPFNITVTARKINGWELQNKRKINWISTHRIPIKLKQKVGKFTFTPRLPTQKFIEKNGLGKYEKIKLVPMACAKVRLTILPKID